MFIEKKYSYGRIFPSFLGRIFSQNKMFLLHLIYFNM